MDDVVTVQVKDSQTNVYKDLPNEVLNEHLAVLFLNMVAKVSMLAVLHHNIDLSVDYKGIQISNDEVTIQLGK